jgi:tRNA wybutosine-synthesizing protein 3
LGSDSKVAAKEGDGPRGEWEDAEVRKARKREEGLRRREEVLRAKAEAESARREDDVVDAVADLGIGGDGGR